MSVPPSRLKAILLALLVTFIWSTSWVLIKIGLRELPAITFAGMRYTLAFVCLLPFLLRKKEWGQLKLLTRREWIKLVVLGIVYYALAQGAQFLGLAYLSSITVSLIINLSSLFVAIFGIVLLKERPTWLQWSGVLLNLVGVVIYFYPSAFADGALIGILAAVVSLLANVFGSILGRNMNMNGRMRPLPLTVISMGIGAILMLITGLVTQGLPRIGLVSWGILLLLAVVNTAFTFTVWNYTLQTLTAMESSIINSTMMVQIAILAWIFLGERIDLKGIIGIVLVVAGTLIVQLRLSPKKSLESLD
ncbi:hypothetical protein EG832_06825 [bacterium]|nr:hypothetical protein [bacterium]